MRIFLLLLITTCSFVACTKDEDTTKPTVEPHPYKITSDTFTSGSWRGFTIGQTTTEVYTQIQQFPSEITEPYLGVTKNIFGQLAQVENKIPLYSQLLLDETTGTSRGVQITFKEDKISSIFLNNGDKLTRWPEGVGDNASVAVGDAAGSVYQKLIQVSSTALSAKLQRISLIAKNIAKAYDPAMSASPLWNFSTIVDGKHYVIDLYFTTGVLTAIHVNLLQEI